MSPSLVLPPGKTLPPLGPDAATSTSAGSAGDGAPPLAARSSAAGESVRNGRAAARFDEINTFLDVTARTLPRAAVLCWLVLWRDSRNGVARTAITDIARRSGCDRRTALRSIKALVNRGLVRVIRRGGLRVGLSIYKVTPVSPS